MLIDERKKKNTTPSTKPPHPKSVFLPKEKSRRTKKDEKIPRMMDLISYSSEDDEAPLNINHSTITYTHRSTNQEQYHKSMKIQEMEQHARETTLTNPLKLFLYNGYSALRIFDTYLITIDTLIGIMLTVGTMLFCYYYAREGSSEASMSWMILSITIVNPLSTTLGMSFFR